VCRKPRIYPAPVRIWYAGMKGQGRVGVIQVVGYIITQYIQDRTGKMVRHTEHSRENHTHTGRGNRSGQVDSPRQSVFQFILQVGKKAIGKIFQVWTMVV